MAQVIKNPDDTFVVTLNNKEQKTLDRWRQEAPAGGGAARTKARQLEIVIDSDLATKAAEHRMQDGPTMRDKYDLLTPANQAAVDAILNAV